MRNIKSNNLQILTNEELVLIHGGNELTDSIWEMIGYVAAKYGQGMTAYSRGTRGEY
tara:strand:- start:731 stop:901 length:171 start_codon:yes stop_codon:yes gene_type:complete